MKHKVVASVSDDTYMFNMLRPLLKDCADDGEVFLQSESEGVDLNQLADFIAQNVQATFEDMTYEDYLRIAKMYMKRTYRNYVGSSKSVKKRYVPSSQHGQYSRRN